MQLSGDKVGLENQAWKKEQADLSGNSTALEIARQNHLARLKAINAEKTNSATPNPTPTTSSNPIQSSQNNAETIVITFKSEAGREAQGSFARADATTVIEILKEAANRGMPATFN